MRHRPFGNLAEPVAIVGQGSWKIDDAHRPSAVAALKRGLDLGMTHIDTAEMYGDAELVVAEAIAGQRDKVFLVSKVVPQNASRKGVVAACERSLARLGTDRLDCYLLHWRGGHPLEETIAAFESLVQAGKILSWGVSNFDVDDLEETLAIAGPRKIACNQVLYHLQERAIEHEVIPWCAENDVAVVGYSPFGHNSFPAPGSHPGKVLAELANAHGVTPRQIALAALSQKTFVIPKASTPEHAAENAKAGDIDLRPEEIARIHVAFPLGAKPSSLPMI
jgi:diketogulonate reductase-like aldo/keto reductase